MALQCQEEGPPDLVLKLAFQFLEWKDPSSWKLPKSLRNGILNNVDLVCKKWRKVLDEEDVGRQLCINQIKSYDDIVVRRNRNGRAEAENHGTEFVERKWYSPKHELLTRMMSSPPPEGRTFKDMYKLSETVGQLLSDHRLYGPDVRRTVQIQGPNKSLREACLHDCRWTVMPTIEKLMQVFDDPKKDEREHDIRNMKQRVLSYARKNGRTSLHRETPTRLEKDALTEIAGKYCVMLAVTNSFEENIFNNSSNISATLEEIINGIESMTGKELATQVSVQLKRTSAGMVREFSSIPSSNKKLKGSLHDIDWPMSPVDCLSLLIRGYWLTKSKVEDDLHVWRDCTEKEWNDAVAKWWLALAESVRQFLLVFHAQLAERFDDVEPLPPDMKSTEVPTEKVKLLLKADYGLGIKKSAEMIFHDLEPNLCEQLFKIYHQQAQAYSEAIRQEYHSVYSNDDSLEHNAKILLDIFLEVPCFQNDLPPVPLASENCDEFLARMEATMNRWNELANQLSFDESALWNPQVSTELRAITIMWGHFDWRRKYMKKFVTDTPTTLQFYVPGMVTAFLCQALGTRQKLRSIYSLERDAKKLFEELQGINWASEYDSALYRRTMKLVNDFRALSVYANTKEHAMMALIPLLPNLSHFDAKRLVYALFTERYTEGDWWDCYMDGFSKSDMNFGSMWTRNIPCALGDYVDEIQLEHIVTDQSLYGSDLSLFAQWVNDRDTMKGFDEDSILNRIFGLPLPANIITAMGEFMVENLYQGDINDVDGCKWLNAIEVRPYLERYCYENPDNVQIVWTHLQRAIENAIMAVEGLEAEDVDERQRSNFETVVFLLVESCIRTRAKSLIPLIMRLEDTQAIVPELIRNIENLADRFEKVPSVYIDTKEYFRQRSM